MNQGSRAVTDVEELWVRVGGGLVRVPGGERYGPADLVAPSVP
jgi:hypothetical protein